MKEIKTEIFDYEQQLIVQNELKLLTNIYNPYITTYFSSFAENLCP